MTVTKDKLVISNDTKHLTALRNFMAAIVKKHKPLASFENKIILATDEAVTNIIEHGYDDGQNGMIEVEVEATDKMCKIVIRDEGKFYDPNKHPSVNIEKHLEEGRTKGLGVFLMRQIMDEVKYRYEKDTKNELTLIKYVDRH
jgi:serine/threonine-protein kinase RsbW